MTTYYYNDPDCDLLYVVKATNEREAMDLIIHKFPDIDTCDYHYIKSNLKLLKDYEVISSLKEDQEDEDEE